MNLTNIWMTLFGTTELLGLNMGFWVSISVVALIVVIENIVFWRIKPHEKAAPQNNTEK